MHTMTQLDRPQGRIDRKHGVKFALVCWKTSSAHSSERMRPVAIRELYLAKKRTPRATCPA